MLNDNSEMQSAKSFGERTSVQVSLTTTATAAFVAGRKNKNMEQEPS